MTTHEPEQPPGTDRSSSRGRVLRRIVCLRPKRAHVLATVRVERDELVVDVQGMAATGRTGMRPVKTTLRSADVEGCDFFGVSATCPCGRNYHFDVIPLLRNETVAPVPIQAENVTGVSYDRWRGRE